MREIAVRSRLSTGVNRLGRRRVDEIKRFVTFGAIGVVVTLVNLLLVWLFSHQHHFPYIAYVTLATECTLLLSFVLNDRLTFQQLISGRAWYVRCARFHCASACAAIITIVVSSLVYHITHCSPVVAQIAAIPVASTANFAMHRLWTYRLLQQRVA